jgi:hypothetical protein
MAMKTCLPFCFFIYLFRLLFCPSLDVSETKNEVVVHYYFVTQNERNIINNIIPKNLKKIVVQKVAESLFFVFWNFYSDQFRSVAPGIFRPRISGKK